MKKLILTLVIVFAFVEFTDAQMMNQVRNSGLKVNSGFSVDEDIDYMKRRRRRKRRKSSRGRGSVVQFGVKAGLNLSNMLDKDDVYTYSDDYKMKPGFHVGATVNIPLTDLLSFETGLIFDTKGYKITETIYETDTTVGIEARATANICYLDIPLTIRASYDLGNDLILFGAFGSYLGIGLTGKYKVKFSYLNQTAEEEEKIAWGDGAKRLDFGLTFGGGIEISVFQIGVSYDLGLTSIAYETDGGYIAKNRVLRLSFAYIIGKK